MRAGGSRPLLAALAAAAAAGAGCVRMAGYERGVTVPLAEAYASRADLAGLVDRKLAEPGEGAIDRAFYVLEMERTRDLVGDRVEPPDEDERPPVDPYYRDLEPALFAEARRLDAGIDAERFRAAVRRNVFGFGAAARAGEARGFAAAFGTGKAGTTGAAQKAVAKLDLAARAAPVREAIERRDEAFWEQQRLVEARLAAYEKKAEPQSLSYGQVFQDKYAILSTLDARLALAPGEALIEWHLGRAGEPRIFLLTSRSVVVEKAPASAEAILGEVGRLRAGIQAFSDWLAAEQGKGRSADPAFRPSAAAPAAVADRWKEPARKLHAALLAPVEETLAAEKIEALFLVGGPLSQTPFHVLHPAEGAKLLIERFRIACEPSFSIYKNILSRKLPAEAPRVLAIGNTSLPMAPGEARVMARAFDGGAAWIGPEAASEARFMKEYRSYNILHFATHGRAAIPDANGVPDPLASMVVLGPAPPVDGFLSAPEVRDLLDLRHTYVTVLSACETAAGGDVDNLAAAFLVAGAPAVVASLWTVSDASTTSLMLAFYRRLLEDGTAEALRRAQLEMLASEAFRHPYFWAAFGVYGLDK